MNTPTTRTMNRRLHRITLALAVSLASAFTGCGGGGAATGTPEERVKARIDEIVQVCRDENWARAADYFAYRGSDRKRKYKDTYDGEDEQERLGAKRGCDGLLYGAFPETTAAYEFGDFSVEEESEGAWHVQVLNFPDFADADPAYVAMLEIDGSMVIGDVD